MSEVGDMMSAGSALLGGAFPADVLLYQPGIAIPITVVLPTVSNLGTSLDITGNGNMARSWRSRVAIDQKLNPEIRAIVAELKPQRIPLNWIVEHGSRKFTIADSDGDTTSWTLTLEARI